MRISDWSSDVCSSDLREERGEGAAGLGGIRRHFPDGIAEHVGKATVLDEEAVAVLAAVEEVDCRGDGRAARRRDAAAGVDGRRQEVAVGGPAVAEPWRQPCRRAVLVWGSEERRVG